MIISVAAAKAAWRRAKARFITARMTTPQASPDLLELARIFSAQQPKPRRTLVFIAFSGEEEGLLGSNYYVNHPVVPLANVAAMINMDMIGRLKDNKLIVGGVGTAPEWRGWLAQANPPVGMTAVMRRPGTVRRQIGAG